MRGFLPLAGINLAAYSGPVVLRYVIFPFSEIPITPGLETYPARVLYGGPTLYRYVSGPQGAAFLHAMQLWAQAYGFIGYPEWLPVAPEQYGHRWPHTGWTWEEARELEPVRRYTLAGVPPTLTWRAV